jgi:Enterobacterial TraT complement resistance protein
MRAKRAIHGFLGAVATMMVSGMTGGCAATQTLLAKKDLVVQSKTSTAIFVDPVSRPKRSVYLDVKSGVDGFDRRAFKQFVAEQFVTNDNGYKIVDDPESAQFTMVAYVLNLEEANPTAAEKALEDGYKGQAILAGGVTGAIAGGSLGAMAGGAVVGGVAEHVTSYWVKDVTFLLVCDVQIRERVADGVVVQKDTDVFARVSDAGSTRQTASETSNHKEYRTRIVTTANQANLSFADAQPAMFRKTAYAMSGFF